MTIADVRALYPNIKQPPHVYYDVANRRGTSPFRPGLDPQDYEPFISHFQEREVTARAQARLDARKRRPAAATFERAADGWRLALLTVLRRQRAARVVRQLAAVPVPPLEVSPLPDTPPGRVELPSFEWDD